MLRRSSGKSNLAAELRDTCKAHSNQHRQLFLLNHSWLIFVSAHSLTGILLSVDWTSPAARADKVVRAKEDAKATLVILPWPFAHHADQSIRLL